jgi:hypothetical protein
LHKDYVVVARIIELSSVTAGRIPNFGAWSSSIIAALKLSVANPMSSALIIITAVSNAR